MESNRNIHGRNVVNFSKALSKILRHKASSMGIQVRPDGFCRLDDVLQCNRDMRHFGATIEDVKFVVHDNDKQRFELREESDGTFLIRAVQGHTMKAVKDEELLIKITEDLEDENALFYFNQVVHGTTSDLYEIIMESGLCRMARNHIHMAIGLPGQNQVISGMRRSCDLVFEVNVLAAYYDGKVPFFVSENNVVLSPGLGDKGMLPSKYFRSAFNPKTSQYLYQKPLKYICVYDLECNCSESKSDIPFNDTIEFPVVIIDCETQQIVKEFHTYVRPTLAKTITQYCTNLTGITNDMVHAEGNPTFKELIPQVHQFLLEFGIFNHEFVFLSCGDFDGKQLQREADKKGVYLPNYLQRWINIKKVFADVQKSYLPKGNGVIPGDAYSQISQYWNKVDAAKNVRPAKVGMDTMLEQLGLPLVGRHHSGIDDARNIAKIVITLLKGGLTFNQSMIMEMHQKQNFTNSQREEQKLESKPKVANKQKKNVEEEKKQSGGEQITPKQSHGDYMKSLFGAQPTLNEDAQMKSSQEPTQQIPQQKPQTQGGGKRKNKNNKNKGQVMMEFQPKFS